MWRFALRLFAAVLFLLATTALCQSDEVIFPPFNPSMFSPPPDAPPPPPLDPAVAVQTAIVDSMMMEKKETDLKTFLDDVVGHYKPVMEEELRQAQLADAARARTAAVANPAASASPYIITVTVDCAGSGDFTTMTSAINSLSAQRRAGGLKGRILLFIKNCVYREKISFPSNLNNMTIQGESGTGVFLSWNDTAGTVSREDPTRKYGTFGSASTVILCTDVIVQEITFVNTAPMPDPAGPPDGQAVALRVDSDRVAFYSCSFFGWQDTLYDRIGRHYFRDCYIQGRVDFIFGNGQSIYEFCNIYSPLQGAYAAQKRESILETTGYVFLRCRILGDAPMTLARAWGNYSRTIYAYSYLENTTNPRDPYNNFGNPYKEDWVFFGEYKNFGPGAVNVKRNNWTGTYILTDEQAAPFVTYAFINEGNWLGPPPATSTPAFSAPPRKTPIPPFPPIALVPPPPPKSPPRPPPKSPSPPPPKSPPPPPKSPPRPPPKSPPRPPPKSPPRPPPKSPPRPPPKSSSQPPPKSPPPLPKSPPRPPPKSPPRPPPKSSPPPPKSPPRPPPKSPPPPPKSSPRPPPPKSPPRPPPKSPPRSPPKSPPPLPKSSPPPPLRPPPRKPRPPPRPPRPPPRPPRPPPRPPRPPPSPPRPPPRPPRPPPKAPRPSPPKKP